MKYFYKQLCNKLKLNLTTFDFIKLTYNGDDNARNNWMQNNISDNL